MPSSSAAEWDRVTQHENIPVIICNFVKAIERVVKIVPVPRPGTYPFNDL